MVMDEKSRKNIEEAEKDLGHATGIGAIDRGECPMGAVLPIACMLCDYGHVMDCHYPKSCEEANCYHYQEAIAEEIADEL